MNAQIPNERNGDIPSEKMHACDLTLTYLRGGLSTCSVVWESVQYFFLKFIKPLMQLCKNFF